MPEQETTFDWPLVHVTTTHALVGSRVFEPYLEERRANNADSWNDRRNWWFGFYFGKHDSRLWVPKKDPQGRPIDQERVINFRHRLGRKAFRILMLGYGIGLTAIVMSLAALFGVRW